MKFTAVDYSPDDCQTFVEDLSVREAFADMLHFAVDKHGNLRLEAQTFRWSEISAEARTGHRVPVARLVIPRSALRGLRDKIDECLAVLEARGGGVSDGGEQRPDKQRADGHTGDAH